jgi:amidase
VGGAKDLAILKAGAVPNGSVRWGPDPQSSHPERDRRIEWWYGAAIAAVFAQFGLGTDTGGSVRDLAVNGVGLNSPTGCCRATASCPLR